MRSMIRRQIRNEYAAAVNHNVVASFVTKWGGNPGLAKVTSGKLLLQFIDTDDEEDVNIAPNTDPP